MTKNFTIKIEVIDPDTEEVLYLGTCRAPFDGTKLDIVNAEFLLSQGVRYLEAGTLKKMKEEYDRLCEEETRADAESEDHEEESF